MILRAATAQDFAFVRAIAGQPENAAFLSDEDDAALADYLADLGSRLLIWGAPEPQGFALFCGVGADGGVVELRRLGLVQPGLGHGAAFLQALVDHAFGPLQAERLWLDTSGENLRAQKAYLRAGFMQEGLLRRHEYRAAIGRVADVMLFGMLRHEWVSRQG